jgi:hypothetical protein
LTPLVSYDLLSVAAYGRRVVVAVTTSGKRSG